MNRDAIKNILLALKTDVPDFNLILSGKTSKRVDGLYKPDTREIIIHNKNMNDDHALIYTAIHEFAHHIHFTGENKPTSSRSHTTVFWSILHDLLADAERKGLYSNPFIGDKDFETLTLRIREGFLLPNAHLMKELGGLLAEGMDLCRKKHCSFDDYLDRVLGVHRNLGKTLIKINKYDIDPGIGYENMKTVASIATPETRRFAEEAFRTGTSPDAVKAQLKDLSVRKNTKNDGLTELERLAMEKSRVEKTLTVLKKRLEDLDKRIDKLKENQISGLETTE